MDDPRSENPEVPPKSHSPPPARPGREPARNLIVVSDV